MCTPHIYYTHLGKFHLAWVVLDNINVLSPPRGVCPSLHSTLFKISESSIKSTFVGDFYFSVYKIFNIFGHFLDNFLIIYSLSPISHLAITLATLFLLLLQVRDFFLFYVKCAKFSDCYFP